MYRKIIVLKFVLIKTFKIQKTKFGPTVINLKRCHVDSNRFRAFRGTDQKMDRVVIIGSHYTSNWKNAQTFLE